MLNIPLAATPSQTLNVLLAQQQCRINVYEKSTGVFLDLYVSDAPVMTGVLCRDRVLLVREAYLGFVGDLSFIDTQGVSDPTNSGFGSRFLLVYFEPTDL